MYSRYFLFFVLAAVVAVKAFAQAGVNINKGKTFAVIIGISGYENKSVPQLQYAHKDAQLFAQYLQSKAGGLVPDSQLQVLINEQATIASVYNALYRLKQQCNENDVAYIYFSGHGDVETENKATLGYLLAYNSPPNNYRNNAISIEDINNTANYLTLQKKAKVMLITDACHSGKLAGDFFKGKQLVGERLQNVLNNEVRLASCRADEEAAESEDWGGGRGVFSYYLLMGLHGMANAADDGSIQLKEIQHYLDSCFAADEVLISRKHKQHPVTDGNPYFPVSFAGAEDAAVYKAAFIKKDSPVKPIPQGLFVFKDAGVSPLDYFFSSIETMVFEDLLHFSNYKKIKPDALPLQIVNDLIVHFDTVTAGYNALIHTEFKENSIAVYNPEEYRRMVQQLNQLDSFKLFQTQLQRNTSLNSRFFECFVQMVHNRVQTMINAYLAGDVSELEKRQYYFTGKRNYNEFLECMQLALSFIPADHQLANILRINQLYLSGVIARLQLAISKKTDSLVKAAYYFQQQSLLLEPYAAYVHNELGNLYVHQKKYDSATYHFSFASALAPSWAIPWSNTIRLNLIQKKWSKAKEAFQKADSLQPNLAYVLMNAGLVMEQEKNFLAAQTYYLRSINENNVHYFPFERLATIYLHTGEYGLANDYFQKAAQRKNQFAINDAYFNFGLELGGVPMGDYQNIKAIQNCENGLQENIPQWAAYYKALKGFSYITNNKTYSADSLKILQQVLMQVPDMPFVHHYLGFALWKLGRYDEAEPLLLKAAASYNNQTVFKNDLTKKLYTLAPQVTDSCLLNVFLYLLYDEAEDYYMLAGIYENKKEQKKLIEQYENVIAAENKKQLHQAALAGFEALSKVTGAYEEDEVFIEVYLKPVALYGALKLARLYEQWGNYEAAEKVLLTQILQNQKAGGERRKAHHEMLKARDEFPKADKNNRPETGQIVFSGTDGYLLAVNELFEKEIYNFYLRMMQLFPRNYYWKEQAGLVLYNRLDLSYKQMPVEEYIYFTNRIPDFAYPFKAGEEPPSEKPLVVKAPFSTDSLVVESLVFHPVEQALEFLLESVKFSGDVHPRKEVEDATAALYAWLGRYEEAAEIYNQQLIKTPGDAVLRNHMIELLLVNNNYTEVKIQLEILHQQKQISKEQLLQLASYQLLAGNFTQSTALAKQFVPANTNEKNKKAMLTANWHWLSGNLKTALVYFKDSVKIKPLAETEEINETKSFRLYAMARLYAQMWQTASALKTLEQAIDAGFTYKYIFLNDPVWKTIKTSPKWKLLVKPYIEQEDEEPGPYENYRPLIEYRVPDGKKNKEN